ncbi:MAG: hypothetical protein A2381_18620 [Bdellovibrionales bacterium RIFOXYB1_FULL_37_110]|nr:MAG: hypothetical protein A2417_01150 [Bdellovibrionales bacterium RIFOXYC1_FULL_37_79]OFZ59044.1 MAG: hypothetical protein A2381_18620 [Bdellovibrionales bacterium RIFOXYB1_FULL_37_110]OFZ65149.1 MAG: hypothetical protein A2577_04935 [Bdellovibrionales bacterium RIFOXYD1_FULL_36_51]
MTLKIQILSENYAYKTDLAEWGFSALIEFNGTKLLFDTGQSGDCVIKNAKSLNVSLKDIGGIILSHGHYDHTEGLSKILTQIGDKKIYIHSDIFTKRYTVKDTKYENSNPFASLKNNPILKGCPLIYCQDCFEISKNIYLVGDVPLGNSYESISDYFVIKKGQTYIQDSFTDELSLVIELPSGLLVITGCAHRGIINILSHIKNIFKKNIYGVIGGTHLHDATDERLNFVVNFLKEENIQLIAPSHCTGMDKIFALKSIFLDKVKPSYCGETYIL